TLLLRPLPVLHPSEVVSLESKTPTEGTEKSEAERLFVRRFRAEAGEKQKLDAETRRSRGEE
ncbi:MAG TPA: hypothetical protein VGH38_29395, partial [Bryobacteraceae bacterium]